jgi:ubiquinone/menaquinone biosynthesis C-methylase UbiE
VFSSWNRFGQDDPLWAVLTWPEKKGGKWSPEEFFEVGRRDVASLFSYLGSLGVKLTFQRALDFGCGAGRLTGALAEHFQEVHGVDISPSMVETARKLNRYPDRGFFHVNVSDDLRIFDDHTFDFVLTLITLQHVPRKYALGYVAEFVRVLKPSGVLVFQVLDSRKGQREASAGLSCEDVDSSVQEGDPGGHEPVMIMSGVPRADVIRTLHNAGARLLDCVEDQCGGEEWLSYRYCATKEPVKK